MSLESRAATDDGGDEPDARSDAASAVGADAGDADRRADDAASVVADDLTKRYDDTLVFDGLDLSVAPGEVCCLLGPSGCGKTTLLHLLAGLEDPTDGRVEIDGEAVTGPDYRWGVVFQDPLLYPWLSVRENVEIGPRLRGEEPDDDHVDELLELVGLDGVEDADTSDLSGGMAQRASLARTLANEPEVLLLDEPFSALDQLTKMELQDELLRIVDELGVTTVFVTHDIDEAVYLGDRVAVMGPVPAGIERVESIDSETRSRGDEAFVEERAAVFEHLEAVGIQ
ncbi:ABC transporter ATP-binding protein [Halorubrum sp. SP3]|uniref:ABC transporter ATP-binding protein n=1 Tax=unclassified Halorubrum TaxID=2642239 RepID=UPI0010F503C2|nr:MULTISPECIES: ABC transporter ATP-binding protein [unclassified Halorubrum]TKX56015.1 ABC transporter ATP-binding protein [Halorubrum sp. SP3]TKX71032.1 ABC transporter ATP-binding protein [Halorubrum sp. SP9]